MKSESISNIPFQTNGTNNVTFLRSSMRTNTNSTLNDSMSHEKSNGFLWFFGILLVCAMYTFCSYRRYVLLQLSDLLLLFQDTYVDILITVCFFLAFLRRLNRSTDQTPQNTAQTTDMCDMPNDSLTSDQRKLHIDSVLNIKVRQKYVIFSSIYTLPASLTVFFGFTDIYHENHPS